MKEATPQPGRTAIELPANAHMIRITAGAGSAGQKTWNIRRPVTLIGASRPAHIVLHDKAVSKSHCVIVNTGAEVLLKDLHTTHGTFCNKERVGLVVLKDGDVVTVGELKIQVAIRVPENQNDDSGCGLAYVEPTAFPKPITLRLDHTDQQWQIEEAVALIGRHERAEVRVDHTDIASRHAVFFRFANAPAIVDLGGPAGIGVNGHRCPMARLQNGDRIAIGPCTVSVSVPDPTGSPPKESGGLPPRTPAKEVENADDHKTDNSRNPGGNPSGSPGGGQPLVDYVGSPFVAMSDSMRVVDADDDSAQALSRIDTELATLQANMAGSWDRLNTWESKLRKDANKLGRQELNLSARETELEAQDAALRGQLHDLSRYHEQILERERELAVQLARIQQAEDTVSTAKAEVAKREADIARRADELRNREHVLAQRWARLQASTCPHCRKPMRASQAGPPNK